MVNAPQAQVGAASLFSVSNFGADENPSLIGLLFATLATNGEMCFGQAHRFMHHSPHAADNGPLVPTDEGGLRVAIASLRAIASNLTINQLMPL